MSTCLEVSRSVRSSNGLYVLSEKNLPQNCCDPSSLPSSSTLNSSKLLQNQHCSKMFLQPTTQKPPFHLHCTDRPLLRLSSSYSLKLPSDFCNRPIIEPFKSQKGLSLRCSISQVYSYGAVDYEKRPPLKWNALYKKISMMEDPSKGSASVLNEWEDQGHRLSKWELCRVVKELRKFRRYRFALEVYDWMNNRQERFRFTSSDTAIQLDLIAKVRGVSSAEEYFGKLPYSLKDKRIYGALLNAYARARMREKTEWLMDELRNRGYANHALPFNVTMTLYINLKEFEKVESVISEMIEKNIQFDIYTYNIWLSSCGYQGSQEKMEEVFERMKQDTSIHPNWTTFSTMATLYIRLGQLEKAEDCIRKIEARITGRDRIPYHYLLSLYGSIGKNEEVYRIWDLYKSLFLNVPNLGFHAVISSLVRLSDIEGAEKIYAEWLSVKSMYDPRIGNLLLGWYVREGFPDKASDFYDEMIQVGGKPNATTWEILAEGHIRERTISDAVSCLKEAVSAEGSRFWKPKPTIVSLILKCCGQEGDIASKESLLELLRQIGCLDDEKYMSFVPSSSDKDIAAVDDDDSEKTDLLLNQLQGSI